MLSIRVNNTQLSDYASGIQSIGTNHQLLRNMLVGIQANELVDLNPAEFSFPKSTKTE